MVKVTAENGGFKVEGTFDFGYIGLYRDDQIEISDSAEEIREEWECVSEALDTENCTDDDIAAFLTDRLNGIEERIQKNIIQINNEFLYNVFDDMEACGREFWEVPELTVPEFMPEDLNDPDYNFYDYPEKLKRPVYKGFISGLPNDGSVKKGDFEWYLRKFKPMFNLDNFIAAIKPEHVHLSSRHISFQCSDKYNFALICAAYDQLDLKDLCFTDWHNY